MAERRNVGVRLLEKAKLSQAEIARQLGVSAAAVCVWAKKLKKYGKESLQPSKASGRPSNLSLKQKSKLLKKMSTGAVAAGFESERWTLRRVQAMIETEFGVRYHANYISRLLHDLGWRVQKPETRAMERDEELIRSWLNQDWNRIKKTRRLGAHRPDVLTGEIIFEDEFGISFTETVSSTWAPRGQTPYLKRIGKYRREISTMAGLTISGKIYKKHFEGSIDSEKMIQGLDHFRRQIGRPFIMIWDRSRTHRSQLMKKYLSEHPEIQIESLPAYAPEVNPEEFCHGNVKRSVKNAVFPSKQDIRKKLDRRFSALRKRPPVLLGCFHHAGLSLNQLW